MKKMHLLILTFIFLCGINNYTFADDNCNNARSNLSKLYKELDNIQMIVMDSSTLEKNINEFKKNLDIANSYNYCLVTYVYEEKYYSALGALYTKKYNIESYKKAITYYKEAMKYAEFVCSEKGQDCSKDVIYKQYLDNIFHHLIFYSLLHLSIY